MQCNSGATLLGHKTNGRALGSQERARTGAPGKGQCLALRGNTPAAGHTLIPQASRHPGSKKNKKTRARSEGRSVCSLSPGTSA